MAEESRGRAVCHMEPVSGGQRKWTVRFSARLLPYTIFRSKLTAYLLWGPGARKWGAVIANAKAEF